MNERRLRPAVRAIVVDGEERVLLVCFDFVDRVVWAMPGGGIENEETDEQTIRRELLEEAGLQEFELGPLVWTYASRPARPGTMGRADGVVLPGANALIRAGAAPGLGGVAG